MSNRRRPIRPITESKPEPQRRGPRTPHVQLSIYEFLKDKAGQRIDNKEIQEATGFENDQVRNAMRNLIVNDRIKAKVILSGQVWEINSIENPPLMNFEHLNVPENSPTPRPAAKTYTLLGTTQAGMTLVEDGDGNLFKLVRI